MPPTEKKPEKKTPEDLSEFIKDKFDYDVNSPWHDDEADDLRKFGKIILGSLLGLQGRKWPFF
jgi:hypothetical protein